jgi:hypothetical protein
MSKSLRRQPDSLLELLLLLLLLLLAHQKQTMKTD